MWWRLLRQSSGVETQDPLDDAEQKCSGQSKQQHPVQRLQRSHLLPALFQDQLLVAVTCNCTQRVEDRGTVIWKSTDNAVSGGPERCLHPVQKSANNAVKPMIKPNTTG